MADFCSGDLQCEKPHASLKRSIEVILRIEMKQTYCEILESVVTQYLQYLQSYLEIFISHLAAAVHLLETDNPSKRHGFKLKFRLGERLGCGLSPVVELSFKFWGF